MNRVKTFDSTGIAPNGKLYSGDLNAIQDAAAAQSDFSQAIGLGTLRVGDSTIQLLKFGTAEARVTAALRTDGVLRGLGGVAPGTFTSTQRDAIPAGSRPYGMAIVNPTANRWEWNSGTDPAPVWSPFGTSQSVLQGNLADIPSATAVAAGSSYYAVDQDVEYVSTGTTWRRRGSHAGDLIPTMNTVADTGRLILAGQAWPSTVGIYADLWAKWSSKFPTNLPDLCGRALIALGTHADVNQINDNDGLAVASRRPAHKTSIVDPQHAHPYSRPRFQLNTAPGGNQLAYDEIQDNTSFASTGITAGPQTDAPTDTIAYVVGNYEVKL